MNKQITYENNEQIRHDFFKKFSNINNSKLINKYVSSKNVNHTKILEKIFKVININSNTKNVEKEIFSNFPIKIKYDLNQFIEIENNLYEIINCTDKFFKGIQFPVSLRTAHSVLPAGHLIKKKATDHVHVDIWGGEPKNIFNVILYLFGDFKTFCQYKVINSDDMIKIINTPIQDYIIINKPYINKKNLINNVSAGELFFFDSCVPHFTVRSKAKNRGRISLDFRFILSDPYEAYEKNNELFNIGNTKYWYLIKDDSIKNIHQRFDYELSKIDSIYGKNIAYKFRENEYLQFRKTGKLLWDY